MRFPAALLLAVLLPLATASAASLAVTARTTKGEPVVDAVVSLTPIDGRSVPPPAVKGEIPQQNQEYGAYVTVVQAGSTVLFPNRDSVQHHVYSLSKAKKFELPLYNPGQSESFVFDVSGVVTLGCNIHDWMVAYLIVVPTPWFAQTDSAGSAILTAPGGRYRLELWHPRLGAALTQEITLADGESAKQDFALALKPDRRIRRNVGAKSGGY